MSAHAHLVSGPADYYRDDLPVSRGQWADIARLALDLLGLPVPESRYDATVTTVRLRAAAEQQTAEDLRQAPPRSGGVVIALDPRVDPERGRHLLRAVAAGECVEAVEEAATALAHRRAMREPHPRSGPQPRCSACCRFKSNEKAPCPCGYVPGQGYAA